MVRELARWGSPLLGEPGDNETFRESRASQIIAGAARLYLADRAPQRSPVTIAVRAGDTAMILQTADGAVRARPGQARDPDARLKGASQLVIRTLMGRVTLDDARAQGLRYEGDPDTLRRVQPAATPVG